MDSHFSKSQKIVGFFILIAILIITATTFISLQRINNKQALLTSSKAAEVAISNEQLQQDKSSYKTDIGNPEIIPGQCEINCNNLKKMKDIFAHGWADLTIAIREKFGEICAPYPPSTYPLCDKLANFYYPWEHAISDYHFYCDSYVDNWNVRAACDEVYRGLWNEWNKERCDKWSREEEENHMRYIIDQLKQVLKNQYNFECTPANQNELLCAALTELENKWLEILEMRRALCAGGGIEACLKEYACTQPIPTSYKFPPTSGAMPNQNQ